MRAKTLVTTVGAVAASARPRRATAARGPSGAAFVLHPAWCAFATLLSTRIWQLNRDD
jgi:tryptophan-rich sensory protein